MAPERKRIAGGTAAALPPKRLRLQRDGKTKKSEYASQCKARPAHRNGRFFLHRKQLDSEREKRRPDGVLRNKYFGEYVSKIRLLQGFVQKSAPILLALIKIGSVDILRAYPFVRRFAFCLLSGFVHCPSNKTSCTKTIQYEKSCSL